MNHLEHLGSALARVDDFIGDVHDEDLDQLDGWLFDAQDVVSRERAWRRDAPTTTTETGDAYG